MTAESQPCLKKRPPTRDAVVSSILHYSIFKRLHASGSQVSRTQICFLATSSSISYTLHCAYDHKFFATVKKMLFQLALQWYDTLMFASAFSFLALAPAEMIVLQYPPGVRS